MLQEFEELFKSYAAELRQSKAFAERWWQELKQNEAERPGGMTPEELWPMGPASHPWVLATYRKYYFLCLDLDRQIEERESTFPAQSTSEHDWGSDDPAPAPAKHIAPKVFVFDLLAGGETQDLYIFLQLLTFIPIGLKDDEPV